MREIEKCQKSFLHDVMEKRERLNLGATDADTTSAWRALKGATVGGDVSSARRRESLAGATLSQYSILSHTTTYSHIFIKMIITVYCLLCNTCIF